VSLASASAEQLALATSNLRLRESLRTQSLRDPLTGLANRRELDIHLPREIARSSRDQTPLCVAVIDIDHFKRFNDTYGHAAGDEVLRAVGSLLRREIRVEDLAARMGGEEFVLVLSNATMDSTLVLAERLLCAVAELEVSYRGEALGRITCSIGLAQCPLDSSDPETLLSLADEALYRAKNLGRNRIEVAHPPGNQLSPQ
jgi:diguanylate cyclase (GGDEF)-like protein